MATNGNVNHDQYAAAPAQKTEAPTANNTNTESSARDLPKDEVGWYFVEQYYTTLSKSPERLHLFYGKGSQFVVGLEAKVVPVSVGRHAIQNRIKELEFQDTKVRISNVDAQGSGDNIVIQVIGEISNRGEEPKKFVQTFVLAQQPSGYFVLNDILRYLEEEVEEEPEAPVEEPAAPAEQPAAPVEAEAKSEAPAAEEPAPPAQEQTQLDTAAVTEKLEEAAAVETPAAEATPAPEPVAEAQEKPAEEPEAKPDVEKTVQEIAEEEVKKPEEPKDPSPTPAATAAPAPAQAPAPVPAPAPAQPEKPKEPPKPMSWASRVAATVPRPAVPVVPKPATPPTQAHPRAPAPAQAPAPAAPQQQSENTPTQTSTKDKDSGNEWQTAETKRQNRQSQAAAAEKEYTMAYVKSVTEKVEEGKLKAHLESFGELVYFDINRTKNCAFVEFKTVAGYNACINANPHTVCGETIYVEQRRPKANAYGGSNYNARGSGRGGRGGYESTRTGSSGGRGGFNQARGRGGGPRGSRGGAQAGTA